MKYGIGQWAKILKGGLLPGKNVGQLNNQTQRLLGQQSLAGVISESRSNCAGSVFWDAFGY